MTLTPAPTVLASATSSTTGAAVSANFTDVQLRRPEGIAVDRDGNLWVADYGRDRVVKLGPDGRLLASVGSHGSSLGEFVGPKGVTADLSTGKIYVADTGNARIQRLASDGTPEFSWSVPAPAAQ